MLYYADHTRPLEPFEATEQVARSLIEVAAYHRRRRDSPWSAAVATHGDLVGALIAFGELHQAVADQMNPLSDEIAPETDRLAAVGTLLGRCIYRSLRILQGDFRLHADLPELLEATAAAVRQSVCPRGPWKGQARIPEGYAFYSLYPEMYVASLTKALAAVGQQHHYTVIGIRSIGTSLAALVAGALLEMGCLATVETVRPRGHPFDRYLELSADFQHRLERAATRGDGFLIVDEGPGLTCSSFISVCTALAKLGVEVGRLALLAAWQGKPSIYASEDHRRLWTTLPLFHTPAREALLGWQALVPFAQQAMGRSLEAGIGDTIPIEDLSYGSWRARLYASSDDWPPVHRSLERTKLLIHLPPVPPLPVGEGSGVDSVSPLPAGMGSVSPLPAGMGSVSPLPAGEGQGEGNLSVAPQISPRPENDPSPRERALWHVHASPTAVGDGAHIFAKFAGLGQYGRDRYDRALTLADAGFGPPVLGLAYGFLLHPFQQEMNPMAAGDLTPELLDRMLDYYAFLSHRYSRPSAPRFGSLMELVAVNSREALDLDASQFLASWCPLQDTIDALPLVQLDGRPQPHEWLLGTHAGRPTLWKTDNADHFLDHSLVGEQAILWDLAGLCEEWEMDDSQLRLLLSLWTRKTADSLAGESIDFYRTAYLAFRLGAMHYAIHSTDEEDIRRTLQHEHWKYGERLKRLVRGATILRTER